MSVLQNTAADTNAVASSSRLGYGDAAYFVTVDFSSFSGKKTASSAKILADNGIDAAAVTDKPRKQLVNKSSLKFVARYRMQYRRLLDSKGIPIWGGWLVEKQTFESLKPEFEAIIKCFAADADAFVRGYESLLSAQCAEYPDLASFIRSDAPTPESVRGKFFIEMSPPLALSLRNDTEVAETGGAISNALMKDFSRASRDLLKSLTEQDGATQHALRPIRTLREKANQFAFSDGVWDGVVGFLDALISKMPKTGKLSPEHKATLMLALGNMEDETRLRTAAQQIQEMDLETLLSPTVNISDDEDEFSELLKLRVEQSADDVENNTTEDIESVVVDTHSNEPENTGLNVSEEDQALLDDWFS